MKLRFICAALVCLASPASAMPSGEFVARWRAVTNVPIRKNVSPEEAAREFAANPEARLLNAEFAKALEQYRAEILAARASGASPRSCPPKELDLTVDGILAEIQRLPAGWQERELSTTFAEAMDRKFPCASARP